MESYRKKGQLKNSLVRLVVTAILIFFSLKAGAAIIDSFKTSSGKLSFTNMVEQMNSLSYNEAPPFLLSLDKDTAVVGFSKNSNDFRCVGCPRPNLREDMVPNYIYRIKKPTMKECQGNSCVCLCEDIKTGGTEKNTGGQGEFFDIECTFGACRSLSQDIPSYIDLRQNPKNKPSVIYWNNGFFFVRSGSISNGAGINNQQKITIFIENNKLGDTPYAAACQKLPCIDIPSP